MEPVDNTVPYKLGQMDARIGNIETDVASIKADVKVLLAREAQQKGSKTTMAGMGAGGVGVGGLIVAALQLWTGKVEPQQQMPPPVVQMAPAPTPPRSQSDENVNSTHF